MRELSKPDDVPVDVVHLVDRFARNERDTVWIETLASEGDWVVISEDRFAKSDEEREAVRRSGLIVFTLDKVWNKQRHWPKAARWG